MAAKKVKANSAKADSERFASAPLKSTSTGSQSIKLSAATKRKADFSVSDTKKAKPSPPNELEPPEDDDVIEINDSDDASDDASDEDASAPAAAAAESPYGRTERFLQGHTVQQLRDMFRNYSGDFPDKRSGDGFRQSVLNDGWRLDSTGEYYTKRAFVVFGWTTLKVRRI